MMDTGFVQERVLPDNGLVWRNGDSDARGHELRRRQQLRRVDARLYAKDVAASAERHDHFLERRIAGALANAVDSALHLPRACPHTGERIPNGHTQIVVALNRD